MPIDLVEELAEAIAGVLLADREAYESSDSQHLARKILASLDALGLVIVPREPTEAMLDAAHGANYGADRVPPGSAWSAMIEAALSEPKPPPRQTTMAEDIAKQIQDGSHGPEWSHK